jgi:hypothetical protein
LGHGDISQQRHPAESETPASANPARERVAHALLTNPTNQIAFTSEEVVTSMDDDAKSSGIRMPEGILTCIPRGRTGPYKTTMSFEYLDYALEDQLIDIVGQHGAGRFRVAQCNPDGSPISRAAPSAEATGDAVVRVEAERKRRREQDKETTMLIRYELPESLAGLRRFALGSRLFAPSCWPCFLCGFQVG